VGRLNRPGKSSEIREARLERLARRIQELAGKDSELLRQSREMAAVRRAAALELHRTCAGVAADLNHLLPRDEVMLDPPEFAEAAFREDSANLVQLNIRGRILQISYTGTGDLVSTEDFRIPYSLEGAIRAFNQELLEKEVIEEQLLFYTVEKDRRMWRYFDPRTYRSGPFDREYLLSLLEQVL
jgi:hypothetical protein